ncbi:MAG: hypothetical protein WCG26_00195 [Chloroflexales bacterium]
MNLRHMSIGPRPDLSKLAVNWPIEFIGTRIFPIALVTEKVGDFGYRAVVADASAESGRSAVAALGLTQISNSTKAFSVTKKEKRYVMSEDDVKGMGGIEKADIVGATASKRSVMRGFETLAAAALFTTARKNAALELAAGKEFQILGLQANLIRRVKGKIGLVCSKNWLLAFLGLNAVQAKLQALGGLSSILGAMASANAGQNDVLAGILRVGLGLPVDVILVGDDDYWQIGSADDTAALVMLPEMSGNDAMVACKFDPLFAMSVWYLPDPIGSPDAPFQIDTEWLPSEKLNAWDATGQYEIEELNSTGAACVKLPSGTVYTTTTTTTTSG